jgi:hypothetical protein
MGIFDTSSSASPASLLLIVFFDKRLVLKEIGDRHTHHPPCPCHNQTAIQNIVSIGLTARTGLWQWS